MDLAEKSWSNFRTRIIPRGVLKGRLGASALYIRPLNFYYTPGVQMVCLQNCKLSISSEFCNTRLSKVGVHRTGSRSNTFVLPPNADRLPHHPDCGLISQFKLQLENPNGCIYFTLPSPGGIPVFSLKASAVARFYSAPFNSRRGYGADTAEIV